MDMRLGPTSVAVQGHVSALLSRLLSRGGPCTQNHLGTGWRCPAAPGPTARSAGRRPPPRAATRNSGRLTRPVAAEAGSSTTPSTPSEPQGQGPDVGEVGFYDA